MAPPDPVRQGRRSPGTELFRDPRPGAFRPPGRLENVDCHRRAPCTGQESPAGQGPVRRRSGRILRRPLAPATPHRADHPPQRRQRVRRQRVDAAMPARPDAAGSAGGRRAVSGHQRPADAQVLHARRRPGRQDREHRRDRLRDARLGRLSFLAPGSRVRRQGRRGANPREPRTAFAAATRQADIPRQLGRQLGRRRADRQQAVCPLRINGRTTSAFAKALALELACRHNGLNNARSAGIQAISAPWPCAWCVGGFARIRRRRIPRCKGRWPNSNERSGQKIKLNI